jgi:hypothetical protein
MKRWFLLTVCTVALFSFGCSSKESTTTKEPADKAATTATGTTPEAGNADSAHTTEDAEK